MNNKGQIIITDILLYLILITVMLSIIVYSTATINDNQVNRLNNREINSHMEDVISALTKTSGTPENWEYMNIQAIQSIGLKSVNNQQISYDKLMKLKSNAQLLNGYFPEGVEYSLTLYPKGNQNSRELIAGKNTFSNRKQIHTKQVPIIIDYSFTKISLNRSDERCPYDHDTKWKCRYISITRTLLQDGKYHIITDSGTQYILSNTYGENITGHTTHKADINRQLEQLIRNDNQTIIIHIKSDTNNTVLVYDNKGREEYLDTLLKPEVYILDMKIAT